MFNLKCLNVIFITTVLVNEIGVYVFVWHKYMMVEIYLEFIT